MKYIVKKEYLSKKNTLITVGSTVEYPDNHKIADALLEHGFIQKGWFNPKQTIHSKLTGLEIALEDYTEGDKTKFTYDEALEIEKKVDGWRLPTRSEWVMLCEEFGQNDGLLDTQTLVDVLGLKFARAGIYGLYWSSTPYGSDQAYRLYFGYSGYVNSSYISLRQFGYSVRLVREAKC